MTTCEIDPCIPQAAHLKGWLHVLVLCNTKSQEAWIPDMDKAFHALEYSLDYDYERHSRMLKVTVVPRYLQHPSITASCLPSMCNIHVAFSIFQPARKLTKKKIQGRLNTRSIADLNTLHSTALQGERMELTTLLGT